MGIFVSANAQLQNYDLAFGAFDDCKESQVDVKITGMDNPEWTVDYLHVYIKYTVVGATGQDDFNIDETKTRISLASNLKVFYEGYNGGFMVNFYESPN